MGKDKEIRYNFKKDIKSGNCYCILSGLQILDPRELTLEHYYPKSRGPRYETTQSYNIFPAYKIINGIKSDLIPCEWEDSKEFLMRKTYNKGHLRRKDLEIVAKALDNLEEYRINPCTYCILSKKCHERD